MVSESAALAIRIVDYHNLIVCGIGRHLHPERIQGGVVELNILYRQRLGVYCARQGRNGVVFRTVVTVGAYRIYPEVVVGGAGQVIQFKFSAGAHVGHFALAEFLACGIYGSVRRNGQSLAGLGIYRQICVGALTGCKRAGDSKGCGGQLQVSRLRRGGNAVFRHI